MRDRRIFWDNPTMTGPTAQYWQLASGTNRSFLFGYLGTILVFPMLFITLLTWLFSRHAYREWQDSWRVNSHREGMSVARWKVVQKLEPTVERVESLFADEKCVWDYGCSRLRDLAFLIALVRGGNESCGMSKLFVLMKDLDDEGVEITACGLKRFLAPYEKGTQVALDSSTMRLMLILRESFLRDSNPPESGAVSTARGRKRAFEQVLLTNGVKKESAEAQRKAREHLTGFHNRMWLVYGGMSFAIIFVFSIVIPILLLAFISAIAS